MAERRQTIIKTFGYTSEDGVTLSNASLATFEDVDGLRLKADDEGNYPLTAVKVTTQEHVALALRQFDGFQAGFIGASGAIFRLCSGGTEYFWNGSAWTAGTGTWNTEAEIAANISSFAIPLANNAQRGKFGVVVNLVTLDKTKTPKLHWVKISYKVRIHSWFEDIVYRSLVPALKAVQPVSELLYKMPSASATFNLETALAAASVNHNLVAPDAVFNKTSDPLLLTDLLQSYNSGTKVVTLSASQSLGAQLQIAFIHNPEVVVEVTHQDYYEVAKVPCIIIRDIAMIKASQLPKDDSVVNKATNTATVVHAPYRGTLSFNIDVLATGGIELARLIDAVMEFFETNPTLKSAGSGESYRLWLRDEFKTETRPSQNGVHSARARAEIVDVLFFKRAASSGFAVETVKLTGDLDTEATNDPDEMLPHDG